MGKVHWWQEKLDVDSSKRIFGGIAAGLGMAMKVVLYVVSIFMVPAAAGIASAQADGLFLGGLAILGITGLTDIADSIFGKKSGA